MKKNVLIVCADYYWNTTLSLKMDAENILDESNIKRFTRLIRQLSSRAQFILITHNKKTMETAEVLYGVTMEEPGVSQINSVHLNKTPNESSDLKLIESSSEHVIQHT